MDAPEQNSDLQSALRLNAELEDTVRQQLKTIQQLREELNLYRRKLFGRSSERHVDDPSQLRLFGAGDDAQKPEEAAADDGEPESGRPKPRRRKKKAEKLPEHLKRKIIELDVSADERNCSCCGGEMPII